MSTIEPTYAANRSKYDWFTLDLVMRGLFWIFIFSGWFVVVEPAPYEYLFLLCVFVGVLAGLQFHKAVIPLIIFLVLYNFGGVLSVTQVMHEPKTRQFVITSIYMAASAVFIANYIAVDTLKRMAVLKNAYILAAVIASTLGMIGYFNIFGTAEEWAPLMRAQGTFKDPNVLSTFIIPPAIFLIQGFMLGTQKWKIPSAIALLIIIGGIFFAFSRGAWIVSVASVMLLAGLTFVLIPSARLKTRIVLVTIFGFLVISTLFSVALSFEEVRTIFIERANFLNSYDTGEEGRFGRQLQSIPTLLSSPNGIGPLEFAKRFGADPHNVFLHAFSSYGWLGGISYLALICATLMAGWKAVFSRGPLQNLAIAVAAPLFLIILQGIQIDTDHWRHFYLLLGLIWGLYAATAKLNASADAAHRPPT